MKMAFQPGDEQIITGDSGLAGYAYYGHVSLPLDNATRIGVPNERDLPQACSAIEQTRLKAAFNALGLAFPRPAISNAEPWAGVVTGTGKPA